MSDAPGQTRTGRTRRARPDGMPKDLPRGLATRLGRSLVLARAALWWERIWPALWPLAGTVGLFLALALLDFLPVLPGWLHGAILIGLLGAALYLGWRGLRALRGPTPAQASRRVEVDSGLDHRPLASLDDSLAAGGADPGSTQLWALHRQRLLARLSALRVRWPRPGLSALDPFALRGLVGLLLVLGITVGHSDAGERLTRALQPDWGAFAKGPPAGVNVWVNPPAYTGIPPLFLDPNQAKAASGAATESATGTDQGATTGATKGAGALQLPVGSVILAQVQGGRGTPELVLGDASYPFNLVTLDAYKISAELDSGTELRVEQDGEVLAAWPITVIPDAVPSIEYLSPPARSERAALKLEYLAEDDYGLNRVGAIIRRIDKPDAAPIELELPLPGVGLRRAESLSFHDLTPHPWAGLAVEIQLSAEDALGQSGTTESVRTVLPERIFNHPVARALVELRKQLTIDPDARLPVVRALGDIYERPDHYFNDVVVALALRTAERRLIHDSSSQAVPQVQQLLWDTALHLEEGELAIAERDLREIQKQLMEALARDADDAEIERLINELREALERFLEALAEQMRDQMARGEQAEPQPLGPNERMLQSEDLQRMLDRAQELARSGARDAARDLLSQLQNMLENLRANPYAQGMDQQSREAMQMMEDMDSLMRRQQDLLDRSFDRSEREQRGEGDPRESQRQSQGDAKGQEKLRRELGEMMRQLGEAMGDIPGSLGRAERAMRDAREALEGGQSGDAVEPQTRALDQLQQGMRDMANQFMQALGNNAPPGSGPLGAQRGEGRDPLGRETGQSGFEALEGVRIPDEMELRRSREILDELRRRSGERNRPPVELDYIDRLLKQF
jgi:uncharacterized protein (TIGR02302 family)